jgi:putative transposase
VVSVTLTLYWTYYCKSDEITKPDPGEEILNSMLGYYCQLRPYHYKSGSAPNESEGRYWFGYKELAKIS